MEVQKEAYFNSLYRNRDGNAKALEGFALRGVKNSVIEKYSDQAHFIYELLQNADDAKATTATFRLFKDKLVFTHNGTRRFTVSDPDTEAEDHDNGTLGDINAITAVGGSNKIDEATIGKFGVGFKAVFQYTTTPHIYDPNIFFKIERFIVPARLKKDYPDRQPDETVFVFPFDHEIRTAEDAFLDISKKLHSLVYPSLFLSNLQEISFKIHDISGIYSKTIEETYTFENTIAERICLTQNNDVNQTNSNNEKLWLFSRKNEAGLKYSVGFFIDEDGHLSPKSHETFCFFPTKENTNLNFIIHAPFLLTDSREGIRAGEQYNRDMINLLAELAADSFVYLKEIGQKKGIQIIDDNIFDIIPYDESHFNDINDRSRISFKPFYSSIKKIFSNDSTLPSSDGYVDAQNAFWADVPFIAKLFSNEQLSEITKIKGAKWVFTSFGRSNTRDTNKAKTEYIDSITQNWLDEDDIIKGWECGEESHGISSKFIESQSIDWLHRFYMWLSDTAHRTEISKTKPIFLNQNKKAVPAIDQNDHTVLFLPMDENTGYQTVLYNLCENETTLNFFKKIGLSTPSLEDEVYNKILPKYKDDGDIDTTLDFKKFFQYYQECSHTEAQSFLSLINKYEFILYNSASDKTQYRGKAEDLYTPSEHLKKWFQSKPETNFVSLDEYLILVGKKYKEELIQFLIDLGVENKPRIHSRELEWAEAYQIQEDWSHSTGNRKWTEKYIDGCKELMETIVQTGNLELSNFIWCQFLKFIEYRYLNNSSKHQNVLHGRYEYYFRRPKTEYFESNGYIQLRTLPWLVNIDGEFVSANELTIQSLHPQYDISSDEAIELLNVLGIEDESENIENLDLSSYAESLGLTDEEQRLALSEYAKSKQNSNTSDLNDGSNNENGDLSEDEASEIDPSIKRVAKEISKKASSVTKDTTHMDDKENLLADEDEYTKPTVDITKRIERVKEQAEREINVIARLEDLKQQAQETSKYSYSWFKALLELEALNSEENNSNSREISISFSKVEHEEATSRTLVLKHPNRYIPQYMEDLADIPLELHFLNRPTVKVAVEVVNVKSYTLRAKLRTNAQIDNIDLSLVTEAKIEAKNPVFLMEELRKSFNALGESNGYTDDFDMQQNLCENIEFVFGPPGTGKTTHLARDVILPMMDETEDLKILVLTPTNKSADVLVRRLIDSTTESSYLDWLVRFGATNDNIIEQSGVFRDKTFDIRTFPRNVTVTTIARFPYDYFLPDNDTRLHLSALKWDYIIIDEASMIPLANIIYPLYKKTPKKFIIAGDPFQIEPITTVDMWKDENIYTMVKLNSFANPKTIPHQYHVQLLTTQYRSVPGIGEVFSKFAYDGVLQHNRTCKNQKRLTVEGLDIKSLNIIKFPVSEYESIFRPKRLQNKSTYQVYSALFAFEFIKYLSSSIKLEEENELLLIGLIAPYKAQADLINKLMASITFPKNIDVQVGTIHGFQGDECDIILALFNPPPSISNSKNMFLNKLNIINVSISRARDYLFILMPDDETKKIEDLTLINKVEQLCKEQASWNEQQTENIEELIFGSPTYLEDNSFSTSHQQVNVYGKPEKKYEVRSETNAIDVQIHE
jgi:Superfamily I DNA and RNA helicases and helicase subunits